MDENLTNTNTILGRFQTIQDNFSKCKIVYFATKNECQVLREVNTKLERELKETRDLEKSHRYHLQNSREMIGNLQEEVSQLVYLKRGAKLLRDEIVSKDSIIALSEKDKETMTKKYEQSLTEVHKTYEERIEEIKAENERKIRQIQHDSETQIAQHTCVVEELRSKLIEMEMEHREKMNIMLLDYEEKLQHSAAQIAQLQDQLSRQSARTDSNIDAYRRKLDELEEKPKQSQFKNYLAQSSYTHYYDGPVERPYSVNRDAYADNRSIDMNPAPESPQSLPKCTLNQRRPGPTNTLQVIYADTNPPSASRNDKKGPFKITKKRKLYTEKDFQDF